MNSSAAAMAEMPATPDPEVVRKGRGKEGKSIRRASTKPKGNSRDRYFLSAGQPGEKVGIGRELNSEQEALIAAFQEKLTFFVVTEYRVETRYKGINTLLVKEEISRAQ